jgi:hypothetical protein
MGKWANGLILSRSEGLHVLEADYSFQPHLLKGNRDMAEPVTVPVRDMRAAG